MEEQVRKDNEPTIKLPLIKGGDSLENLLNDMLSEQSKYVDDAAAKKSA